MKRSLIIVCILSFGLIACGCTGLNTSKDTLPSVKYVAIYEYHTNQSTLIGTPPYTPIQPFPIPTPVPMFDYDNSHGILKNDLQRYGIVANASLKVLIGKIDYAYTPTMIGFQGMAITGVYDLPFTVEEGFTIDNVTSNGTVMAIYRDQPVCLKPGENMTFIKSSENTTGSYLANTKNMSLNDSANLSLNWEVLPWPVTNEQIYTLTNEGAFNKSGLEK